MTKSKFLTSFSDVSDVVQMAKFKKVKIEELLLGQLEVPKDFPDDCIKRQEENTESEDIFERFLHSILFLVYLPGTQYCLVTVR
jgi:hypothetical protein